MDLKFMADDVALAYRRKGFTVRTLTHYYNFPTITVAALNNRAATQLLTDSDSLFAVLAVNHRKQYSGQIVASAGCGIKITDAQTGYSFGEQDLVPSEAIAGCAEAPSILPFPYILAPLSRLRAEIVHLAGHNPSGTLFPNPDTTPISVDLTLVGIRMVTSPFTRTILMPEC
jgi:hypothetical protein